MYFNFLFVFVVFLEVLFDSLHGSSDSLQKVAGLRRWQLLAEHLLVVVRDFRAEGLASQFVELRFLLTGENLFQSPLFQFRPQLLHELTQFLLNLNLLFNQLVFLLLGQVESVGNLRQSEGSETEVLHHHLNLLHPLLLLSCRQTAQLSPPFGADSICGFLLTFLPQRTVGVFSFIDSPSTHLSSVRIL